MDLLAEIIREKNGRLNHEEATSLGHESNLSSAVNLEMDQLLEMRTNVSIRGTEKPDLLAMRGFDGRAAACRIGVFRGAGAMMIVIRLTEEEARELREELAQADEIYLGPRMREFQWRLNDFLEKEKDHETEAKQDHPAQ